MTYGGVLAGFRATTLEGDPVTLVLETLRSDETLDLGVLGVGFGALLALLGLHLTANDELTNLYHVSAFDMQLRLSQQPWEACAGWRRGVEPLGREHSHRLPC